MSERWQGVRGEGCPRMRVAQTGAGEWSVEWATVFINGRRIRGVRTPVSRPAAGPGEPC